MDHDQTPGPIRSVPPPDEEHERKSVGSEAAGFVDARSVGRPLKKGGAGHGGSKSLELTFYGTYKNPWSPKQELKQLAAGDWSPSSDDFEDVALHEKNTTVIPVERFFYFLGEIQDAGGQSATHVIKRVNVITHATPSLIAFHGSIDSTTGGVSLSNAKNWKDAKKGLDLGAIAALWTEPLLLKDLRDKFRQDAKIIFYACNSGSGVARLLLNDLADALQVKTYGFDDSIWYFPNFNRPPHKLPLDRNWTTLAPYKKKPPPPPPPKPKRGFKHVPLSKANVGIPKKSKKKIP